MCLSLLNGTGTESSLCWSLGSTVFASALVVIQLSLKPMLGSWKVQILCIAEHGMWCSCPMRGGDSPQQGRGVKGYTGSLPVTKTAPKPLSNIPLSNTQNQCAQKQLGGETDIKVGLEIEGPIMELVPVPIMELFFQSS